MLLLKELQKKKMAAIINNINVSWWALSGAVYLVFMLISDIKEMTIDDRYNYLMYGLTFALFFLSHLSFWRRLILLIIAIIIVNMIKKTKVFGDGDISALYWLIYGFALLNIYALIVFLILLVVLAVLSNIGMKIGKVEKIPFFPMLFLDFIITCFVFNLF